MGKGLRAMAIQQWSDQITVGELVDDPQFTEDITALAESLEVAPRDVVLHFSAVGFINSSDIALLLRLRKLVISAKRRLILCGVNPQVWGVFQVTGLDKILEFTNDIATALATVQLAAPRTQSRAGKRSAGP
jgi:anti-anti-sigma factor